MTNKIEELEFFDSLDPRVFSEYSMVFYNSNTLEVIQVLQSIPRGNCLKNLQKGISIGDMSVGLYKGTVPTLTHKFKYIDGDLIPVSPPNLAINIDSPLAIRDSQGLLLPMAIIGESYELTIMSLVDNGRIFRYQDPHPLRISSNKGKLSDTYIPEFTGKSKLNLRIEDITPGNNLLIKVESPLLRVTFLEVYCTNGEL